jgi:hypothetical protein
MAADGMTLAGGTDASTRPRGHAQGGLSIVVPLFNEAANLAALHERLGEVAAASRRHADLRSRWCTSTGSRDARSRKPSPALRRAVICCRDLTRRRWSPVSIRALGLLWTRGQHPPRGETRRALAR